MKKRFNILVNDIKSIWIGGLFYLLYLSLTKILLDRYCPSVLIFGIPCPACGMTRAFVLLFKGKILDALNMHPLVLAVFFLFLAYILFRYILLLDTKSLQALLVFLIISAFVVYIIRMILYFPTTPPMVFYKGSLLGRLLGLV